MSEISNVLEYGINTKDRPKLNVVELEQLRVKAKGIVTIFETLHSELTDLLNPDTEDANIYDLLAQQLTFDEDLEDLNYDGILETIDQEINELVELATIFELHDLGQHAMMFDEPDEEDEDCLLFQCRIVECGFVKKMTQEDVRKLYQSNICRACDDNPCSCVATLIEVDEEVVNEK